MTTLDEKVRDIIENSDFDDLPLNERSRIRKYTCEQQILTLWQTLQNFPELTNETWKKKQLKWLETCVNLYRKEFKGL